MTARGKKVLLIAPSAIIARGFESIFSDLGEFDLEGVLSDLSKMNEIRLASSDADVVILDPMVLEFSARAGGKALINEKLQVPVVALRTAPMDSESLKAYDDSIGIMDDPATIIHKLRAAVEGHSDSPKAEGEELSAREKEILVSVAKGMLNKEIADQYNISIYTVITHRKNITRKTGIKTVAGLTVYALLNNLIDVNSFE